MDYELRSQGASLQAYAQMMGGDMNAIRNSLRPSAQGRCPHERPAGRRCCR